MERTRFLREAEAAGVPADAAERLYERLYVAAPLLADRPQRFDERTGLSRLVAVLVWLGVLLVIGAHAWWSTTGYESLGFGLVLALTVLWMVGFLTAAEFARRSAYFTLVAGFAAVVAFYTPLAVYAFEQLLGVDFDYDYTGFYPWVSEGWIFMELAASAAAAALFLRYRRPFQVLPLCIFVGFFAMDFGARVFGIDAENDERAVGYLVLVGALAMAAVAVFLDYRGWRRYAFWPHVASLWLVSWGFFAVIGNWKLVLFALAVLGFAEGVWLARMTHLAFGAVAGWGAIAAQAHGALFPFLLVLGGLAFIAVAIWLSRADTALHRWLAARALPAPQRDLAV